MVRTIERKAANFTPSPAKAYRLGYSRDENPAAAASGESLRQSIHDEYAAWLRAVAERDLTGRDYRFDEALGLPGGIRLVLLR
ncbi:hypothetical protein GXW78_25585 [Roseomonas terrae]|uniref:Uncharacterized protein n=1 Tax=Neoroseomonas terrae TaxID=424799 RepID=A0ABS5EPW0_9PROT|nr:hypothetical protein [Neoroseomonas terrae]